ncbi:WD40 repeat-like protein [Suillus hirtellus]|nr:WD40 repeat-like protein [Suillus hirtellus]
MLDSGQTEMGPIKTGQRWVNVLVYSPSGDKIASGGSNETICIWDTKTGELVFGPIEELEANKFVRVFDGNSSIELHRFEHDDLVNSIALSPKHNVLACVGQPGVAQLWDTESYEPLLPFSRDGRYLASSGLDKKLTLWVVKDMVPELISPTPSCLDVDVTNRRSRSDVFADRGSDNSYGGCFQTYQPYRPSAPPPGPYGRSWNHNLSPLSTSVILLQTITVPSRRHSPANESTALQPRPKHSLFAQYTSPQPVSVAAGGEKVGST